MTVRTWFVLMATLSLGLGLTACDTSKAETGPKLPEATGEGAPRAIPCP